MEMYSDILKDSQIPKYKQIMKLIVSDIQAGIYALGERIPSINEISEEYLVSRDTVEKAYKKLRNQGILESVPGKGFYVCNTSLSNAIKVCLLFNKLSNYKKETYDGFVKTLADAAMVDLHIYNYNVKLFDRIISVNLDAYDYFVIVPHFHPGSPGIDEIVKKIPADKVIIIDKKINSLFNDYPTVYQDFEHDIIDALTMGKDLLDKYHQLNLVYPLKRFFSKEIAIGFTRFCNENKIPYKIIDRIEEEEVRKHEAFVVISDEDLVYLIKQLDQLKLTPGKDIGIISYNETPVKQVLAGGITTISTNHEQIGEQAARMVLHKKPGRIKIPFNFIRRHSL